MATIASNSYLSHIPPNHLQTVPWYHGTTSATEVKSSYFRDHGSTAVVTRKIGDFLRRGSTMEVKKNCSKGPDHLFSKKKVLKKFFTLQQYYSGDGSKQKNRPTSIAAVLPRPRKK